MACVSQSQKAGAQECDLQEINCTRVFVTHKKWTRNDFRKMNATELKSAQEWLRKHS